MIPTKLGIYPLYKAFKPSLWNILVPQSNIPLYCPVFDTANRVLMTYYAENRTCYHKQLSFVFVNNDQFEPKFREIYSNTILGKPFRPIHTCQSTSYDIEEETNLVCMQS